VSDLLVPGVDVSVEARPRGTATISKTAVAHVPAITERGPADRAMKVTSLTELRELYGDRVGHATAYDAIDALFRIGVPAVWVSRVLPATADKATITLVDRAGAPVNTLRVDAKYPGDYGNRLKVQVIAGDVPADDDFVLVVTYDDVEVERSYNLTSPTEAVEWGENVATWVTVADLASATVGTDKNPAVAAATALAGGDDDRELIVDADWQAALDRLLRINGPGQVLAPGRTTAAAHAQLLQHAEAMNRFAVVDTVKGANAAALDAAADAVRAAANVDPTYGMMASSWVKVPGVTRLVPRTLPGSVVLAGMIAREDEAYGVGSAPAGGDPEHGRLVYAYDLATTFTDAERAALHRTGVSTFRILGGDNPGPYLYGFTTLVDRNDRSPENLERLEWQFATNARLRMAVVHDAENIAERYVDRNADGRGHTLAAFRGELLAMLGGYYADGFLYGATAEQAYAVDVSAAINPPDQLAQGRIAAAIQLRMSPLAEFVQVYVVKYAITEELAA
jgi:hypothetical protein